MKLDGGIDRFDLFGIHGWAADPEHPDATLEIEVLKNGARIATVPAAVRRPGDGEKAFWFDPFEWLEYGENRLELRFAGTEVRLPDGARTIYFDAGLVQRFRAGAPVAHPAGYRRDAVSGDAFLDEVLRGVGPAGLEGRHVVELAPADGRLLAAVLARGIRYGSYVGLETSATRARHLVRRFGNRKTRFVHGSLLPGASGPGPDVLLGLAAIDRLFPSFAPIVLSMRGRMAPGAVVCFGFPRVDPEMLVSAAWVEDAAAGGEFVRVYSRAELEWMLGGCGLDVEAITTAGSRGAGQVIVVRARNTSRPPSPMASSELGPVTAETAGATTWLSRALHAPRLQPSLRRLQRWGIIDLVKRAVSTVRPGRRDTPRPGPVR
jgi:hypothetical protein